MKISELSGKRVLIMGLGRHGGGASAARFFVQAGAHVTVTDCAQPDTLDESRKALNGLPIRFVLGKHDENDFTSTDLVIQNPAVPMDSPLLEIAKKAGAVIDSDVGIFFQLAGAPIIGVTGTKGKSTTTALIGEILRTHVPSVLVAGNIRTPVFDVLHLVKKDSVIVLELSSWHLEMLARNAASPHTAVVTRIFQDHLNRYADFSAYTEAKRNIIKFQKSGSCAVLCADDPIQTSWERDTAGTVVWYGNYNRVRGMDCTVFIRDGSIIIKKEKEEGLMPLSDVPLRGEHMATNVLASVACSLVYNVPLENMRKVLGLFHGLPGRLETVALISGVEYVNDTTATSPDATLAAIQCFISLGKGIHLIAGGTDKNLDYSVLAEVIRETPLKSLVLLPGSATDKLTNLLDDFPSESARDMETAVALASSRAQPGDVVLLSPGAASFGIFMHEFHRGDAFTEAVKKRTLL